MEVARKHIQERNEPRTFPVGLPRLHQNRMRLKNSVVRQAIPLFYHTAEHVANAKGTPEKVVE